MKTETLEVAGGYIISAIINGKLICEHYFPVETTTLSEVRREFKSKHKPLKVSKQGLRQIINIGRGAKI